MLSERVQYQGKTGFLNQAHAGHRLVLTWFLKIVSARTSYVCVCLPPGLLITSGMIWHDMDPMQLVKQVLQLLYGNCSCYR